MTETTVENKPKRGTLSLPFPVNKENFAGAPIKVRKGIKKIKFAEADARLIQDMKALQAPEAPEEKKMLAASESPKPEPKALAARKELVARNTDSNSQQAHAFFARRNGKRWL